MKFFLLIFLPFFTFHSAIKSQVIHNVLVPGSSRPTLQQALDKFYYYAENDNYLTGDENYIETQLGCNINVIWAKPMLVFKDYAKNQYIKWTAFQVISYCKAFRYENDASRKQLYKDRITKGAEFLLWCKDYLNFSGGYTTELCSTDIEDLNVFHTSIPGVAFIECFKTLGDSKYYLAAEEVTEFLYDNPAYPYNWPTDPQRYYGNPNHLARPLYCLAEFYKLTGDQKYLDRCIQLSEEIMAWQDYLHQDDPWNDPNAQNGDWDGGWYWYMYDPNPYPLDGCDDPNGDHNGKNADKRMGYHTDTMRGLLDFFNAIEQHRLLGTTTIRNEVDYVQFRNRMINSIIRSTNFIIDNQRVSQDDDNGKIMDFKDGRQYYVCQACSANGWNSYYVTNNGTGPHGMSPFVNALSLLSRAHILNQQDKTNLNSIINMVSTKLYNIESWGSYQDVYAVVMDQWSEYIEYLANSSIFLPFGYTLVNPSFEDLSIKWELWSWDSSGVSISTSQSRTGKKSVHILDQNNHASKWASILVNANPNVSYQARAYAYVIDGPVFLYFHFYDTDLNLIQTNYVGINTNSQFSPIILNATSPANTKYLDIMLYADYYGTTEAYWDDVSLTIQTGKQLQDSFSDGNSNLNLTCFPNPFNLTTNIQFAIDKDSWVKINIFNSLGELVDQIFNERKDKGHYEILYNASNLPSGIYIVNLIAGNKFLTSKILHLK